MAEGRLSADELEQRLEDLYAARTYGELEALLADLPVNRSKGRPRVWLGRSIAVVSAVTLVLVALGGLAISRVHTAVAVLPTDHPRHLTLPDTHQAQITAASLGTVVVVVLLACAALLWALMDSRSPRRS